MMVFDDMGFCGDFDAFCGPLGEGDIASRQTEPDEVVEDDYSDEEIDVDELERRMWRDKMRLKRLKEQSKAKGKPVTVASNNLREWWKDEVGFDRNGAAAIAQEQARRKKIEEQFNARLRLRKELMQQSKANPRNKQGGKTLRINPMYKPH